MLRELLAHLIAQCGDLQVVQAGWQAQVFKMGGPVNLVFLAVDIPRVLGCDFDLLDHRSIKKRFVLEGGFT